MTTQPKSDTPETDALRRHTIRYYDDGVPYDFEVVPIDCARKLERERDEARQAIIDCNLNWVYSLYENGIKLNTETGMFEAIDLQAELTQLRKVCNDLAHALKLFTDSHNKTTAMSEDAQSALTNYSTLPHVKAKGTK